MSSDIYSCDDHLDLHAVPPDLWTSRLPSALVDRGPHVLERDGERLWVCDDQVIGRSGVSAKSALAKTFSAIGRAGIEDDGYRAGTPDLRLQDMDRDGLLVSVIYGPLALGFHLPEDLEIACYAAWKSPCSSSSWSSSPNSAACYRPCRCFCLTRCERFGNWP